jgi:imidazolonepropionase-like amidohydrolase
MVLERGGQASAIVGACLIDGVASSPLEDQTIWIEAGRIRAIGPRTQLRLPANIPVFEALGKYVIPGLMNANVHLLGDARLQNLLRYEGRYEDLIEEAAQVALKSGLTTVFDTWGPRRALQSVRDRIDAGQALGSRIFCAGNIVGFDGPLSADFFVKEIETVSPAVGRRINATWVEHVGRQLMWRTPEEVREAVRLYIERGIDFVKYASNEHGGPFLAFSLATQTAIVEEAHCAGRTAQAHTTSVEGLRVAIEAGCNLIQHANLTGPTPIPGATLELLAKRQTGTVVFPWTERALQWLQQKASPHTRTSWLAADTNVRHLIDAGVPLLLANDGTLFSTDLSTDPVFLDGPWSVPGEDSLISLTHGHFAWLRAMEEKGCEPMAMLHAATRNIAEAYGKSKDLGTVAPGKIADLLILDKNPLESASHYRAIHSVIKSGSLIDRSALPVRPLFTGPAESPLPEEASYVPFLQDSEALPPCPMCR